MRKEQIGVGCVCRLKGHKIIMTIIGYRSNGAEATCAWFDKDNKLCERLFLCESLDRVQEEAVTNG